MSLNTRLAKVKDSLKQHSGDVRIFVQYVNTPGGRSERFSEAATDALYERARRESGDPRKDRSAELGEDAYTDLRERMNAHPRPSELVEGLSAEEFRSFMARCGRFVTLDRDHERRSTLQSGAGR